MREIKFEILNLKTKTKETFVLSNDFDCINGWLEDCVLRQYTDLKDKNGKEIYEGDIIQDGAGLILIVTFCNGRFCSTYNNSCETICGGIDNTDEVIGNIYENENLIK